MLVKLTYKFSNSDNQLTQLNLTIYPCFWIRKIKNRNPCQATDLDHIGKSSLLRWWIVAPSMRGVAVEYALELTECWVYLHRIYLASLYLFIFYYENVTFVNATTEQIATDPDCGSYFRTSWYTHIKIFVITTLEAIMGRNWLRKNSFSYYFFCVLQC